MISRKEMQERMEKEVETLRVFQQELRGQIDLLKVAFAKKANESNVVVNDEVVGNVENVCGGDVSVKKEQ
jgi:hypothetical protein